MCYPQAIAASFTTSNVPIQLLSCRLAHTILVLCCCGTEVNPPPLLSSPPPAAPLVPTQAPRGSLPVWKQIPSPLARMAMDTMMYLQERYPEVLDIDSNDDSDDYGDEYNAELEEGFNKLETYTNMLTRVSAGIETLTFKPPGINTRAGKRGGGFAANNEMEAAARAWARKWLVKPGSKGASKQRQRKVAEQRTQPSQPQNPRRQNLQQPQYPQAPHMSVGAWGWWGRVIRLLLSLVPLWLVCWCQQMQVGAMV